MVTYLRWYFGVLVSVSLLLVSVCGAVDRYPFLFEISHETQLGTSVFVLGSIPELGQDNPIFAVKLEPTDYPIWRVTVGIPFGTNFTYRYATRLDAPESLPNPSNITYISDNTDGQTPAPATPYPTIGKTVHYYSSWAQAFIGFTDGGSWQEVAMQNIGAGRTPTEFHYLAEHVATWGKSIEFYFRDNTGNFDKPSATENYSTALNGFFVQDGNVFNYTPPAAVSEARLEIIEDFESTILENTRDIRVWVPRGYDQNIEKSYPVLYMHDGQNIFEPGGPFGCWYVDGTSAYITKLGWIRETLIIGVDNMGEDRMREYNPPCSGGIADQYAQFLITELKPYIDSQYRTLDGAENTSTMGSSMGGLVSAYLGWDFSDTFGYVAGLSSSFEIFPEIIDLFATQPYRDIHIYLDSGNMGEANDGMWASWNARDTLIHGGYVLEDTIQHYIFYGAYHNEAAWAERVHIPLIFLLNVTQEPNPLDPHNSPTPTSTASPSTATPTPTSSTSTTPTPINSRTPTPFYTATPTPNPSDAGLHLTLNKTDFAAGDLFHLDMQVNNPTGEVLSCDTYILLDVYGEYWCYPSWRYIYDGIDYRILVVPTYGTFEEVVLDFNWPTGAGAAQNIGFYGACFYSSTYEIFGNLREIRFSFH